MIFKRALPALVLAGKKTETRRTWAVCRVKVGRTYAVRRSRFEKAKGRVLVLSTRQEPLGAITEAGARAEGFASQADFFRAWREIHKSAPDLGQSVWVVTFCKATEAKK